MLAMMIRISPRLQCIVASGRTIGINQSKPTNQITDLNGLRLFAEVVEHGSYTATGRGLGIQTARLNRRIRVRLAIREASR
jgi:hypothetical protein